MITREEYFVMKTEIEEKMKKSRYDEHKALAAVNERYEQRLDDLRDEYRRKRQDLFGERDLEKVEVSAKFKDIRRELWLEDCRLVERWRGQLPQEGGEA